MVGKLAKAVLITTGGFLLFPVAVDIGKTALFTVAAGLLLWFLWAIWRIVVLCRAGAFRADAAVWKRESFGFAAGIVGATPLLFILLGTLTTVRGPDDRMITAGPKAAFQLALDTYHADTGLYPANQDGLEALVVNPGVPRWTGPYINAEFRRYMDWFDYSIGADGRPLLVARPRSRRKFLP